MKQHQLTSTARPPACILDVTERGIRITEHPVAGQRRVMESSMTVEILSIRHSSPSCLYFFPSQIKWPNSNFDKISKFHFVKCLTVKVLPKMFHRRGAGGGPLAQFTDHKTTNH